MKETKWRKEVSKTHCRLIELIMNIYNYLLWSQNFQWNNVWDFVSSQPEIPFHQYTPSGVRTSNMSSCQDDSQHCVRWEPHASRTCEVKEISRLDSLDRTWPHCRPLGNLLYWAPSCPCPVLPACVLWNFNWIVNDTEEWHNIWETSKNQSGGALFLTVTKQKTLRNWQVQAARPG